MKTPFLSALFLFSLALTVPCEEIPDDAMLSPELGDTVTMQDLRLNLEGGYSYRTASVGGGVPDVLKSYIEDLMSGSNIAITASYFFGKKYGICLHFSRAMFSNSKGNLVAYDAAGTVLGTGSVEDDIAISMYSVGLAERHVFKQGKVIFIGNLSLGPVTYVDEAKALGNSLEYKGSTFGFCGLLGLDFKITPNVALGADISYVVATLQSVTINGEDGGTVNEGLNRFDFNAGVKYYY